MPRVWSNDRQSVTLQLGDRRVVALRIRRETDVARQDGDEAEFAPEPDMQVEQLREHRRRHMGVDMGRDYPRQARRVDLGAQLGFRRVGHQMGAQARDVAPEIAVIVDQPGGPAHGRDRRPSIVFPLAGQGQMHAQIERRIGGCSVRYLAEPGAGRHDRAASDKASFGKRQKATVRSVTHPDVVDMKDGGAFDA